jgi:Putative phage tail protein
MGSFFGGISNWFSGLPSWGKLLIQVGVTAGLDILARLLAPGQQGPRLRDLQYSSSAYGGSIPRCRGTVRLPGNVIWGTPIAETKHDDGGNTSYSYSVSVAVAFARGPAQKILRLFMNGGLVYTTQVTDAAMTGTVTSSAAGKGAIHVTLNTGSGATLTLAAGAIIQFREDPTSDYQVQSAVSLGPSSSAEVGIWPPLNVALTGGWIIKIPGLTGPTWDQSWFQGRDSDGNLVHGSAAFYLGTETQMPDPTMQAHQGPANVPGYRGLVYVVFTGLQLLNAGNMVPNFSAEVAFDSAGAEHPYAGPITDADGYPIEVGTGGGDGDAFLIPGPAGFATTKVPYVFIYHPDPSGNFGTLYRINPATNVCEGSIMLPPAFGALPVVDYDGYVYVPWSPGFGLGFRIDKFNAITGDYMDGVPHADGDVTVPEMSVLNLVDDPSTGKKWLIASGVFGGLLTLDRAWVPDAGVFGWIIDNLGIGGAWEILTATVSLIDGPFLGLGPARLPGELTSSISTTGGFHPAYCVIDKHGNFWYAQGEHVVAPAASIDVTMSGINIQGLFYDSLTDSLIIYDLNSSITRLDLTGTPIATVTVAAIGGPLANGAIDALGTLMLPLNPSGPHEWTRLQVASLAAGSTPVLTYYGIEDFFTPAGSMSGAVYDEASGSIWTSDAGNVYRLYLDRAVAGEVNLADVIGWLCEDAGLLSTEYDVSLVTGTIGGVQLDQQPVKDSLTSLLPLGPIDAAEIDGKLVFVPRGGSSVFTIPEDDLGALESIDKSERRLSEMLQPEIETPYRVTILFYDQGRTYQQAAEDARRISQPYASDLVGGRVVMNSRKALTLTVPVSWTATAARQAAERLLFDFWVSRFTYTWKTSVKWLRLDPTDVGQITYQGETFDVRLTQADRGASFALEFTAAAADSAIYSSVLPGDSGLVEPPPSNGPRPYPPDAPFIPGYYVNGT